MTPTLDRFLHQWAFYKRVLLVFFAINVFSVVAALVIGVNFFIFKKDMGLQQARTFEKIENIDLVVNDIIALEKQFNHNESRKISLTIKTRDDELVLLQTLDKWHSIKNRISQFTDLNVNTNMTVLIWSPETQSELQRLTEQLQLQKASAWQSARERMNAYNDTSKLLIITGLLTLLFGVMLPSFVTYLMGRALNHIRVELQNTALSLVKTWSETRAGFGDGAFKNVEFWLQILLLFGSYSNRISSHPAAQISSELAHLVRIELQKQNNSQTAA